MSTTTMTVDHPRWGEFTERLTGPEGCHFQRNNPEDVKSTTWKCTSSSHFELATPILQSMGMNVEDSIAYFRQHGGYCDCEILFNVKDSAERERTHTGRPPRRARR